MSSELKARLIQPSSLVTTEAVEHSLPAAGMVSTVPTGRARVSSRLRAKKSHTSPSLAAPMAIPLAESIGAAAADGEHEVEVALATKPNAFMHQAETRIGLDAAELDPFDARLLQRGGDPVVEPALLDRAAAEQQQGSARIAGDLDADVVLHAAAEQNLRRIVKGEIVHRRLPGVLFARVLNARRRATAVRRPAGARAPESRADYASALAYSSNRI